MLGAWSFVVGLTVIGLFLLMLELFIIPGFGVTGILGLVGILGAVWYASVNLGIWVGIAVFGVSLILSVFGVVKATSGDSLLWLRNRRTSPGRVASVEDTVTHRLPAVGTEGVAITMLRPAGIVRIDDHRYDVVAEGPIVESGSAVKVVELIGNVIKVRAT